MARLFPDMDPILTCYESATEGEMHLLHFLNNSLSDEYEIYFQPFLNGDRPDIIIMRENVGVMIIEVKDWNLDCYKVTNNSVWQLVNNDAFIKSPIKQVFQYKENIFNLHVENLHEKNINNTSIFTTVSCAIYFHESSKSQIKEKLFDPFENDKQYLKWLNNFEILSPDQLTKDNFDKLLHKKWLDRPSKLFDSFIYNSLKRHLKPPFHTLETGKEINYSSEQEELIKSKPGMQKIKGVAGCGKTLVLAKRAVNAHVRTNKKVLILTFNISLRNYIHDRINDVRDNFSWSQFYVIHYHEFFKINANNLGLAITSESSWEDIEFFESKILSLDKYDCIFIDEGQDFEYEWFQIIKNYFLKENGEFVIFTDEKQNIYRRELDPDKKTKTNIPGRWNVSLKKTYRLSKNIANVATQFQKYFWESKYEIDALLSDESQIDMFVRQSINYTFISKTSVESLFNMINEHSIKNKIHPNDIAILAPEVNLLRHLDYYFRNKAKYKTQTMFEEYETFLMMLKKNYDTVKLNYELEGIRKSKKFNFWMNPGTMKLSTIHSFKGWEINSVFLLIHSDYVNNNLDELIYTGLTRCRNNLFIINLGIENYHKLFINLINEGLINDNI